MTVSVPATIPPPKDVLIFVPGLGQSEFVQVAHVSELLCWELNQQAPSRASLFASAPTSVGTEVVHRIERTNESGVAAAVLDVYSYDAVAELERSPVSKNPLIRVVVLALTVAAAVLVLVGVFVDFRRRAKSRAQLGQAVVALLTVLCLAGYFVIAVIALIEAIAALVRGESTEPVLRWPQWVVLIGAVVGGLFPTVRERMNWLGERSVQMARFCYTGSLRNRLTGGLQDLVDRVAQRPEVERVHVLGYSFGSLVAMDTIYPHTGEPGRSVSLVHTLITIGSPFDLVRMVRPSYPDRRVFAGGIHPLWVNIYQPIDVLGSNHRNDDRLDKSTVGLKSVSGGEPRKPTVNYAWNADLSLNAVNTLMFKSISVHAEYWDDSTTARSALGQVVTSLTATGTILQ